MSAVQVTVTDTCPPGRNAEVSTDADICAQANPAPDKVSCAAVSAACPACPGLVVNDAARAAAADACSTRILFWLYRPNATMVNSNTITIGVTIANSMIEEPRSPAGRRADNRLAAWVNLRAIPAVVAITPDAPDRPAYTRHFDKTLETSRKLD